MKAMGLMQAFINTHPGSPRIKEANQIIDNFRAKLEMKEYKGAELYFNMGHYRAAAISFASLMNEFPDSQKSEEYKYQVIKSYYLYAINSVEEKKLERFEQVVTECNDFMDRFPESKLKQEVEQYLSLSQNNLKATPNEQITKTN
jgi:outer membrane protein assembly factor BamD